ncbi:transmembrane protein 205 [Erpetoichthys calabaricus]|uniref:Transmembrane protein 205 n=1 Tax=Erpetoichthys calabaricus TaxID=27687 RepID=A0A8C4TMJ1_ERPCA|nr:transmembrane protein 205 [Erpetoichthys calabaricus]XP_028679723.1 transmembrane protein 205 [Erpetoichthys calabaricus]
MPTEGQPTDLVKVAHLLILSACWGMQLWVTFVAGFVMAAGVSRHTFGQVQSKLFPFYFYGVLGSSFLNLAIYAVYHPRELLDTHESVQIGLFFASVVLAGLNAQWFGQTVTDTMLQMQEIEKEHRLGDEVGMKAKKEAYKTLREKDPKYKSLRSTFFRYHGLSSLCNLLCVLCTGANLCYTALNLQTI